MQEFKIYPILGRKTDVPQDSMTLFNFIDQEGRVALTHDTGGVNYDFNRKRHACTKSYGYAQWSNSATDQATKCLGLFELYDGVNRDHILFDNGRFYVYDGNLDPNEAVLNFDGGTAAITAGETITEGVTGATAVVRTVNVTSGTWGGNDAAGTLTIYDMSTDTFTNNNAITSAGGAAVVNEPTRNLTAIAWGTNNANLISAHRIGSYVIFTDAARTNTPYKWANGDDYVSKLIASGTEYKFKYILSFQRRVIGLNSDQTDGNIDVRYSTAWPATAIASLNFPAANQLYIPNDDPITGGATMGTNKCFIYCENSIQELIYYADYETPFRLYTIVENEGAVNHQSIVSTGNRHFLFNRNRGFCEYRGGNDITPISRDIEEDVRAIAQTYYDLIVGTYVPMTDEICWTVPGYGAATPNRLFFYKLDTQQWRIEDKVMRFVDGWRAYTSYTWNNLISDLGGSGATWSQATSNRWGHYLSEAQRLVYANTDGQLYYHSSEGIAGAALDGHRIEPILDFGAHDRYKFLKEVWFNIGYSAAFSIDVSYRSGNTVGEVVGKEWTSLGSVSCDDNTRPVLQPAQNARLHQIRWGTDAADEKFEINDIVFKFDVGSTV
jgi:hypothetical protein